MRLPSADTAEPTSTTRRTAAPDPPRAPATSPRRLTLEERAAHTNETERDCRSCKAFVPAPGGMGYGWCRAFRSYVKLYHPAGEFYSQCQFHVLRRLVDTDGDA